MGNRDEVRTLLLSLVIARKGATPITILESDYFEMEKKPIPYRKFGYNNSVQFLQSMPESFVVEEYNGGYYVRGIPDKSKHVSSLVERQKIPISNSRTSFRNSRYPSLRYQTTFNRHNQHTKFQQVRIAHEKLCFLVQYIKDNPSGVSLQNAVLFVQQLVPNVNITPYDLHAQLYEVSHQLRLDGNMIYAIQNDLQSNVAQQPRNPQPLMEKPSMQLWNGSELPSDSVLPSIQQTVYAAGQEDFELEEYLNDEDDFVPVHSRNNTDNCSRRTKTSELLATDLAQHVKSEQTDMFNYSKSQDDIEINEDYLTVNSNNMEMRATEHSQDKSEIISDRIKTRLKKLLQKYPNGIWCAELPEIYLQEYKVHLNYDKLGFTSVREFTSYLPKVFYMTQVKKTDDFKLYSADKRPVVPKTDSNETCASHDYQYDEHETEQAQYNNDYEDAPIPSDVSPTITKKFAPDDVMNYGDDVGKILVTDLKSTKTFLEIYIVEVFHPNFFWIHLRENKNRFKRMTSELHHFYELNKDKYIIAKVALKRDLNCACVYSDRWHRGIIKSVKPDFRVTVFFYDYGTLKTYAAEDIYYLHSKFSTLPAQAIPCSLYNVKPSVGDRWKKSVNDQFVDKIADTLLAATIITVDSQYNSMMVMLTDTSEEEDVCINNWLVDEKLAQNGNTVRMSDIINYPKLDFDSSTSIRISVTDNVNKPRHCRDQSISHDERTHVLSDIESEDIEKKTVESLNKIPAHKRQLLQLLSNKSLDAKSLHVKSPSVKSTPTKFLDAKSPNTSLDANSSDIKSLDAKSQSSNSSYSQNGRSRTPKEFISVLEKLEKLKLNGTSNSNPNTSISKINTNNENNVRQIDSSRKKELQYNSEDCYGFMSFSLRNSDDENENDFGSFRSLYGGHGLMEPIDWSVIRDENNLAHRIVTPMRECKSDVEDKSESYNQRNELPGKQYFLNLTSLEKENFLPENNIDYDVENASNFLETLKDNTVSNHTVTVMLTPNVKRKTLHDSQSEDMNSSINIELNDIASSKEMDQKVDKNDEVCNGKVRAYQKIKDRDSNTDSKSVSSNISNNKENINREMSECSSNNSFQSNTNNKAYNPRFKTVLDMINRKQMDSNSSFINTSESSSSEQIPLSSYSCSTSDDTIISSDDTIVSSHDEQFKASNVMDMNAHTIVKEQLSKKLTDESHSNSEGTRVSLETDSIASSNVNSTKQHQLNQSSDFLAPFCNINDSNHQLTTIDQTMDVPKLMQQMLKIVQNIENNSELDSDDLSQDSLKDYESDESKEDDISDDMSETYEPMNDGANMTEIAFAPSNYDCDVAFDDSKWDAGAGPDFFSYLAETFKQAIQITEIQNDKI